MKQLKSGMTGLAFAKVINENAEELGTTEKLKFERMSANHLANTINEQLVEVGSDKKVSFETAKVAEVYNEEVVNPLVDAGGIGQLPEEPDTTEETGADETGDETGLGNEDETTGNEDEVLITEDGENASV